MKIEKIFNNNVILSKKDDKEIVIIGKGIAFNKKVGDIIDKSKIEKQFILQENNISNQMKELLSNIPINIVEISYEIIEYAKNVLNIEFNEHIYITLTDHINFAIERKAKGINFINPLHWEIKKFHKEEYEIGLKALSFIKDELNIEFNEDEAASIALHLVNARSNVNLVLKDTIEMTKLIQDILNIIKYSLKININENTLSYERLVTHLKFFFQRIKDNKQLNNKDDFLFNEVKKKYKKAYNCMFKIYEYILNEYGLEISKEEMAFLTVHIQRIIEDK